MEMPIPVKAISVRQPWAWAIVNGHKDVENRDWKNSHFRGLVAIHAALGMTQDEYNAAYSFMLNQGIECPKPWKLERGTIVGVAEITDFVEDHKSPWFFGPKALVIGNAYKMITPPGRVKGNLGFFDWQAGLTGDPLPNPFRWMMEWPPEPQLWQKGIRDV